jgi:hypothetical protein
MATCKTKASLLTQFSDSPATPLDPSDFRDLLVSRLGNYVVLGGSGFSYSFGAGGDVVPGYTLRLGEAGSMESLGIAGLGSVTCTGVTVSVAGVYLIMATATINCLTETTYLTVKKWTNGEGSGTALPGAQSYAHSNANGDIYAPTTVVTLASLAANDWVCPVVWKDGSATSRTIVPGLFAVVRIA